MRIRIFQQILYLIFFISLASLTYSITIDQLINSYNYDYDNGTIIVINQTDYMIDSNNNGINDTLIINLTTNPGSIEGIYKFIIELADEEGIILNYTTKSITASNNVTSVLFKTNLLSQDKFNYSIRINDANDNLVFRKYGLETNTYNTYEEGIEITVISDQNINNDYIRVNLTLNVTEASTSNVTVVLKYNDSTISSTEEKTLIIGMQNVSIDFNNETIKSTHYYGNFTIDTVVIGNKIINTDKNTSIYNYETFAKTSYIKSYASGEMDTNDNNLSDYLEINFTVNIKTAGTYNISTNIYDLYDNYIASINETKTLSTGEQIWQTKVNGSDIYLTRIDGPYKLSFTKLSEDGETKDIVYNPYITNITYYTDFERPLLPDLTVKLNASYSSLTKNTNLTINISNRGQAPAFNVFLDVFDDTSYSANKSKEFLDINEYAVYNFTLENTSEDTIYFAIVDFNNYVDESNESNNIYDYTLFAPYNLSINIKTLKDVYGSEEFVNLTDPPGISNNMAENTLPKNNYLHLIENYADLTYGYTIYEVCNPTPKDYTFTAENFKVNFNEVKNKLKNFDVQKQINVSKEITVYDYGNCATNETVRSCIIGSHTETITEEKWDSFNPAGKKLKAGECSKIKIYGSYPAEKQTSIDNWLSYAGQSFKEYAWWNTSFDYFYPVCINNSLGEDMVNGFTVFNGSQINTYYSNLQDLRLVYTNSTELNYTLYPAWNANNTVWVIFRNNVTAESIDCNYGIFSYGSTVMLKNETDAILYYESFEGQPVGNSIDTQRWYIGTSTATISEDYPMHGTASMLKEGTGTIYKDDAGNLDSATVTFYFGDFNNNSLIGENLVGVSNGNILLGYNQDNGIYNNYTKKIYGVWNDSGMRLTNNSWKHFVFNNTNIDGSLSVSVYLNKTYIGYTSLTDNLNKIAYFTMTHSSNPPAKLYFDDLIVVKNSPSTGKKIETYPIIPTVSIGTTTPRKTIPEEDQSRIVNNGSLNSEIYLLMKVQLWNGVTWLDEAIIIDDTEKRTIPKGKILALDTIWNPNAWNTSTNTYSFGTYRVWVAATNKNNLILQNKDGTNIMASYNFTLFAPVGDTFSLNSTTGKIAIFDEDGNLFLKNTLIQLTTPVNTPDNEFLLKDNSNIVITKINSTGFMEIKGTLTQNQANLTNPPGNDFLIKDDNNNVVAYINESGFMFLKGSLYENSIS